MSPAGEDLALPGLEHHFAPGDSLVSDTDSVPTTRGRTGVAIGIVIVTLLALAFYFYWRMTGMRDDSGQRPPPPREMSVLD
jgi:hypothetical protein